MSEDLTRKIERAKELLKICRHAAMATVNEDGSPHNSPFRFLYDPKLEYIYWGSHPDSMHSQNVTRTGKIFVALYDAIERGGLYFSGEDAHEVAGEELKKALEVHNSFRTKVGESILEASYYMGDSPQRMWSAKITHLWVNYTERDIEGHVVQDTRKEITAQDLLC